MIQFNLLPDVKLAFVKAQRVKRLAVTISVIASVVALAIMLILIVLVDVVQKKSLNDVSRDVTKYSHQVQSTPDLNQILTIQNQLNALPALNAQKPQVTQLFGYISQLTPSQATISKITLDFGAHSWEITGSADSLTTVNQMVDTYKFTTYSTGNSSKTTPAFSNVVLTSFGINNNVASYDITANFAAAIFNSSQPVKLTVPNIISTRSQTQQPQNLFTQSSTNTNGSNQ